MKMRRYDIVSGIILILSFIDFALAAPALVQRNHQAGVDAVHIPKDAITMLGKRGADELEHVVEEYFKTSVKPVEPSDARASLSSAPPGPDQGLTNMEQAPGPIPASSTANQRLLEPSSSSDDRWSQSYEGDDVFHDVPLDGPTSSEYGSHHGSTGAHAPLPKLPDPKPSPSTDSKLEMSLLDPPPAIVPASQKESTKSGFNWKHWLNPLYSMGPLTPEGRLGPASSTHWIARPSNQGPSNPGPSTSRLTTKRPPPPPENPNMGLLKIGPPKESEDKVVPGLSPSPELTPPSPNLEPPKELGNEVAPVSPNAADPRAISRQAWTLSR